MCRHYRFSPEKTLEMKIAAALHDLGKLAISNAILDKPGKLDDREMETMKSHTYYTTMALRKIEGFERITRWAGNHHEKLDGSGYPFGYDHAALTFEERLMGCLDIYQALTEDRPYRDGMGHDKALSILREQAGKELIDREIVEAIDQTFPSNQPTKEIE